MSMATMDASSETETGERFYGKYRGVVINNADLEGTGRIQVQVIGMTLLSSWAMPCLPYAGIQSGIVAIPAIGTGVWVEFEHGNPDFPIWTGCYHSTRAEVPALAQTATPPVPAITMQTSPQTTIQLSELPPTPATGGILLRSGVAAVTINSSGIYLNYGPNCSIQMTAAGVAINGTALVVSSV